MNRVRALEPSESTMGLSSDAIVGLLAHTLGWDKSRDEVLIALSKLGMEPGALDLSSALQLLNAMTRSNGLVAVAAKLARSRLARTTGLGPASSIPPGPATTPPPAMSSMPAPPVAETRAPPGPERRPRAELTALLAHSLGAEKSEQVVVSTARRLGIDPTAFTRDEALRVLDDMTKTDGIVGVTARFAKPRCVLRFPG